MAKAPKKLQIADFVLGAFYENHNYNGRHVVGQLTGAIENKAVMGRWEGIISIPGFDPVLITEGTESMLGWDRITRGVTKLAEPILSRKVEDLDEKDAEIARLRARLRDLGTQASVASSSEDRHSPKDR